MLHNCEKQKIQPGVIQIVTQKEKEYNFRNQWIASYSLGQNRKVMGPFYKISNDYNVRVQFKVFEINSASGTV